VYNAKDCTLPDLNTAAYLRPWIFKGERAMDEGAFSIDQFCKRYQICRSTFYKLLREGDGPVVIQIGARKRITPKAATDWERRMEKKTVKSS
jgi:hypothetical protein